MQIKLYLIKKNCDKMGDYVLWRKIFYFLEKI